MENQKSNLFYSVRPKLVNDVCAAGGTATAAPNFTMPGKHAWNIRLDKISIPVIVAYYREKQLDLPAQIAAFMAANGMEG